MTLTTEKYRFHLPKKAVKSDCPRCGTKHHKTLSRYVDAQTGQTLPDEYGRCDRESNCGYHLSPYAKNAVGSSYANQLEGTGTIPREWFKMIAKWKKLKTSRESCVNTLVQMEGASQQQAEYVVDYVFDKLRIKPAKLSVPIHSLPDEVFTKSVGHYDQNRFAMLLRRHFGIYVANELLHQFQIGTSTYWNNAGACVFWLIDEQGRKRGGQIKLFDKQFNTVKYVDRNGDNRSRTSWVHAALSHHYAKIEQDKPDWLTTYIEQADFAPCLFGLPQLVAAPKNQPIALVEAPKTAVLCTPYFPQFVWLAVIGRSYLNAERLAPLKGRNIVLFPDLSKDGRDYAYWKGKADSLRRQGFNVLVSDRLGQLATDEDREKGYDLADYLLTQWKGYPHQWDQPTTKPAPVSVPSTNQQLADVLARCLKLTGHALPLYQFKSQINH